MNKLEKVECPKCLGQNDVMEPREKKGFKYTKCNLCNSVGTVSQELYDDYIFSLNEENYEDDYETNNGW